MKKYILYFDNVAEYVVEMVSYPTKSSVKNKNVTLTDVRVRFIKPFTKESDVKMADWIKKKFKKNIELVSEDDAYLLNNCSIFDFKKSALAVLKYKNAQFTHVETSHAKAKREFGVILTEEIDQSIISDLHKVADSATIPVSQNGTAFFGNDAGEIMSATTSPTESAATTQVISLEPVKTAAESADYNLTK